MTAVLYVEGGGKGKALRAECRKGFARFLAAAGLKGRMPKIVASGSRQSAFDDFRHALNEPECDHFIVLLVDSEGPVAENSDSWMHLRQQDGWARPASVTDDSAHLMVQCMEAWFLADKACLAKFFGQGFNGNALPGHPEIEKIPKNDLLTGLKNATRQCKPKGEYAKGQHAFAVLAAIDPDRVLEVLPRAALLVDTLMADVSGA